MDDIKKEIRAKIMKVLGKYKVQEYDKIMKSHDDRHDYCFEKIEELEMEIKECFDEE